VFDELLPRYLTNIQPTPLLDVLLSECAQIDIHCIGAWYRKLGFIYGMVALLCHILLSMLVRLTVCLRAREMCSRILQGHHLYAVVLHLTGLMYCHFHGHQIHVR